MRQARILVEFVIDNPQIGYWKDGTPYWEPSEETEFYRQLQAAFPKNEPEIEQVHIIA